MCEPENIQLSFLESIRAKLPANLSLADELSEVLHISRDSVYRRIRGETILSLAEVKILCNRYGVSVDELLSPAAEMVSFQCHDIDHINFTFEGWLRSILGNLEMLNRQPDKELICSAKEIPLFYYFNFPELAAFKFFFWMKTLLKSPIYQSQKFDVDIIPHHLLSDASKIWNVYTSIPSTEIWNEEAFKATLAQLSFYQKCGFFSHPEQVLMLYDQFIDLLNAVCACATAGRRNKTNVDFKLYKSDLLTTDNTVLFKMGSKRITFIMHNTMNILTTSQKPFCKQMEDFLTNLQDHSIQLNTTTEQDRSRFFKKMIETVEREKATAELNLVKAVRK